MEVEQGRMGRRWGKEGEVKGLDRGGGGASKGRRWDRGGKDEAGQEAGLVGEGDDRMGSEEVDLGRRKVQTASWSKTHVRGRQRS